jgi:ATP-dependent helicase/DNAse subunit B
VTHSDIYPLIWEAEKRRILGMLKRFIPKDLADQQASGFKPALFETALAGGIHGIRVQGRVDRIDIGAQGFRVVDYKSRSAGLKKGQTPENAILKGESFQLPVYLALAQTWLEAQKDPAAKEGRAVFYELEDEDTVADPPTLGADFWKEHGEAFYKNLAMLVKNIETGAFFIRPSDSHGHCQWCDYESVCRKEHKPTQYRSENSIVRKNHEVAFTPPKD